MGSSVACGANHRRLYVVVASRSVSPAAGCGMTCKSADSADKHMHVAFQLGVFEQRLSGGRPRAQNAADDELESQNSDHGLVMGPLQNQVPLFFRDGKRRIDYVLVYEDNEGARLGKHDEWRSTFMANLRQAGLDMEEELELCLRAPLQAHPNPSVNWSAGVLAALRIPNIMEADVPNKPLDYYTCTFKCSKLDRFLGSDNQDEYFTVTQRVCVAYEILQTARYGARRKAQIGIDRLIEEGVYAAAFPFARGMHSE
ncbi:hypothetical protein MRX96_003966 [Rhipicephalus microplus]